MACIPSYALMMRMNPSQIPYHKMIEGKLVFAREVQI
jgi:hypothetical protein